MNQNLSSNLTSAVIKLSDLKSLRKSSH
jgi:hypothetical protein